jgi:magnesium chelatase subunit H
VSSWVLGLGRHASILGPEEARAAMRDRLARLNPTASARVANRLLEASDRKFWAPDAATLQALRRAGEELEDRLEGVSVQAAA